MTLSSTNQTAGAPPAGGVPVAGIAEETATEVRIAVADTGSKAATTEASPPSTLTRTCIVPAKGWQALDLKELWRYRELTWFLAMRDIKVRYKQTVLGAAWAIIQPVMQTLVFTVFFNGIGGVQGPAGVPYALWVFAAMVPWQLFENAVSNAGNSLVGSQNLITKVYFPRLAVPISTILAGLLDFAIALILLVGMLAWYGRVPTAAVVMLPMFILMALVASLAVGLWLSALNVQYRDVRYVIPFLARIWFFVTPVVYQAGKIREKVGPTWEAVYALNPMAGVVEGFRWALLGTEAPSPLLLTTSAVATSVLLLGGLFYFKRMEQTFADVV
jgi:lipopolysaccharide transport system permease protein